MFTIAPHLGSYPGWSGVDGIIFGGSGKILDDPYELYDFNNQPNLIFEAGSMNADGSCVCD